LIPIGDYDDSHKQWPKIVRFEAMRYAAHRVCHLRRRVGLDTDSGEKKYMWFRDVSVYRVADIDFIVSRYGLPDNDKNPWSFYVSGFTFDWPRFNNEQGRPPSFVSRREHNAWRDDVFKPGLDDYILRKDLVFEIDRHKDQPLDVAGRAAQWLLDGLNDKGMLHVGTECIFSGDGGYHVVVPDVEEFFDDIGYKMYKRTAKSLSRGAIAVAQYLLDEFLPGSHVANHGGRGRDYAEYDIHFSPMFPQGVRRCAYALTEYGTISLPVTSKELTEVTDVNYYKPYRVMNRYRIKGRGCPSVYDMSASIEGGFN